jgi:hypothetical protein
MQGAGSPIEEPVQREQLDHNRRPLFLSRPRTRRRCRVGRSDDLAAGERLPNGDVWWTFGFESFGALATVEADLRAVAAVLADRLPPEFTTGQEASYPAWLQRLVGH